MFTPQQARAVREPAVAGSFYPRDAEGLGRVVENLLGGSEASGLGELVGVVAPHAGYIYSGGIAGRAFASLATAGRHFERVLLMGPAHYLPVTGIAASSVEAFATPLGEIPLDVAAVAMLERADLIHIDDAAHEPEHSLEVELPFLQKALGNFTIVPLLVGWAAPRHVAQIVARLIDEQTFLVVSTDLSHYLDDAAARKRDLATAEAVETFDFKRLGPQDTCGFSALSGALCAAAESGWGITRLALGNSGGTSGDYSRVVGYGAWALSAA